MAVLGEEEEEEEREEEESARGRGAEAGERGRRGGGGGNWWGRRRCRLRAVGTMGRATFLAAASGLLPEPAQGFMPCILLIFQIL